ncbi:zinc-ribbon domain containing protein [Variovorax sp. LT1R20]|uniref:zinc-ribbon domain containing protein n=1 Tax=Variovorax sp. LT1R20 TaxID=3443729 RepID=UPI003F48EBBB
MKSNKQRRAEIKALRRARAARIEAQLPAPDQRRHVFSCALGVEPADADVLLRHNNTCGPLPRYYVARPFVCRDCGAEEIWTAKQQKWWYEVVHGSIESSAARCLACRRARRASHAASREGKGANLLGEASDRLRMLARSAPTADARAAVNAALESKWWSLRTLAITVLGHWGANEDIVRLRALFDADSSSRGSWEYLGANEAAKALAGCLRHPADEAWAIEACLRGNANPWRWRSFLVRVASERIAANAKAEFARRPEDPQCLVRMLALMRCVGQSPSSHQMAVMRAHPRREVSQWAEYFPSEVA